MSSKWDDRYFSGYTAAAQWVQPYDGADAMAFQLRPGQSASQAVKDFLTGPTIADYRVIGVASEMDELRDELGDQKFDKLFGSADSGTDGAIPMSQRLKITSAMYTLPFWDQMMEIAAGDDIAAAEAAEPAVAAGVEEAPEQLTVTSRPTPEAVGAELGVEREEDYA
jgi:hypothetical protein